MPNKSSTLIPSYNMGIISFTFLHMKHRLHSHFEKSLIERVIKYFKDITEYFDDCYPCVNNKEETAIYNMYTIG
jgi:hypothetical protein